MDIARAEVKRWKAANDYFNDVAHHQRETNDTEFLHHMTFVGAMAEFEREPIRERVKAGLAHARTKGQRLGRHKVKTRPR